MPIIQSFRCDGGVLAPVASPPFLPNSLQVINQGGPNNGPYNSSYTFNGHPFEMSSGGNNNYQGLSWSPAAPGTYPIDHYNIYRNGGSTPYDSVSSPISITGYIAQTAIVNVAITGTAGQCSCTGAPFYGEFVVVTGTPTGSGSITGYVSGNVYLVSGTGTNTFTLKSPGSAAALTTTAGSTTGLTFTVTRLTVTGTSGGFSLNGISDGLILPGLQLFCNSVGFVPGTAIRTYLSAPTGGGGNGVYAVNFPQTCGSVGSPVTFTGWSFNDTASTGCISIGYLTSGNTYVYTVSAVDNHQNEGPKASANAYLYRGIAYNGCGNFDYGTEVTNYADTSGASGIGPYNMACVWPPSVAGGFQPVFSPGPSSVNTTCGLCPLENFNPSGFKYLVMDIKVNDTNYQTHALQSLFRSRSYGTIAGQVDVLLNNDPDLNLFNYCTPIVGQYVTCKVPLSDTAFGTTNVHGYFVGTAQFQGTLTVTSIDSTTCAAIGGSAYASGSGLPATCYVTGGTATGGLGNYTITSPNIVGTEVIGSAGSPVTFVFKSTIAYKIGSQWGGSIPAGTGIEVDNFGFTAN